MPKMTFLLLCLLMAPAAASPTRQDRVAAPDSVVDGTLSEINGKRRIFLVVRRSAVVDAGGEAKSVLAEVFRPQTEARPRFSRTYNTIARQLNKYMNRYQSISAVPSVDDAEFIVYFNLLEIRRPLGTPYPYGELYVILNEKGEGRRPRVIWRTRKSPVEVEDAARELIKALKITRGEK